MNRNKKSKPALVVALLYLLAVVVSFIVMLATQNSTPMSGIFLVMVTAPWSLLLTWLLTLIQAAPSPLINGIFLLIGGAVNGYILYKLISAAGHKFKQ